MAANILQKLWGDNIIWVASIVDPDLGTKQDLLEAVPTGQNRRILYIGARDASASFAGIDPATFGFNAGATNVGAGLDMTSMVDDTKAVAQFPVAQTLGTAGQVFGVIFSEATVVGSVVFDVVYMDVNVPMA